jgi:hypothetical protein
MGYNRQFIGHWLSPGLRTLTDNLANLMGEAAGFLPLAIAVFGEVDPATCELNAHSQVAAPQPVPTRTRTIL